MTVPRLVKWKGWGRVRSGGSMTTGMNHRLFALTATLLVRFGISVFIPGSLSMGLSAPAVAGAIRWRSPVAARGDERPGTSRDPARLRATITALAAKATDPSVEDAARHIMVQFDQPVSRGARRQLERWGAASGRPRYGGCSSRRSGNVSAVRRCQQRILESEYRWRQDPGQRPGLRE